MAAGEIGARFPISGPSISRHLSILKGADLVSERREGNRIFYRLEPERIAGVVGDFLSTVCPTLAPSDLSGIEQLMAAFAGCDAVAHCAGINREIGSRTFQRIHIDGTRIVVEAAKRQECVASR